MSVKNRPSTSTVISCPKKEKTLGIKAGANKLDMIVRLNPITTLAPLMEHKEATATPAGIKAINRIPMAKSGAKAVAPKNKSNGNRDSKSQRRS